MHKKIDQHGIIKSKTYKKDGSKKWYKATITLRIQASAQFAAYMNKKKTSKRGSNENFV